MVIVNIECWGWLATCYHLSHSYESGVLVDGGGSCMNVTSKLWRGNWGETGAASSVIHHIGWAKLLLLVTQRWLLPIQCSLWGLHQVWCPTIVEVLVGQFAKEGSPCAVSTLLSATKNETWRMCVDSRAITNLRSSICFLFQDYCCQRCRRRLGKAFPASSAL